MHTKLILPLAAGLALGACQPADQTVYARDIIDTLQPYCGQAFEGRVTSDDPRDADWAAEVLTIHVRECLEDEIRIPLHVGENRSRTWIITRTETGLRLKHDHRHEDGSEDVLTQYGGDTYDANTALVASFPADDFSKALFEREGIPASMENTWTIILSETGFRYALDRPDRHFAAEFDLTTPVDAPPAPWGYE